MYVTMTWNDELKRRSPRVTWIESQIRDRYSNSRILDVGFVGRYPEPGLHLALRRKNANAKVIGLDINVDRVLQCRLPDTIVADASSIGSRDNSFDVVLCLEMLEHLYSPMSVLREFHRVLRPGGDLVITTPNAWSWSNVLRNWMVGSLVSRSQASVYRRYLGDADHKQFYDPLSLLNLLDHAGFKVFELVTKNHAIPVLRQYSKSFELLDLQFYPMNRLGHYLCLIARKTTCRSTRPKQGVRLAAPARVPLPQMADSAHLVNQPPENNFNARAPSQGQSDTEDQSVVSRQRSSGVSELR
jgi:2-polyprenyl-3-methyl-5-hydroxy-6-metoxy-1,4-benzoquinol methylase